MRSAFPWQEKRKEKVEKMNKKNASPWLQAHTPPGTDFRKDLIAGIVLAAVITLIFFFAFLVEYTNMRNGLFETDYKGRLLEQLRPGAVMADIRLLLRGKLTGTILMAIYCIVRAVLYYRSFFTESKSIYLMKRLPDKNETLKRSISLPAIVLVLAILFSLLLLGGCAAVYFLATPKICLPTFRGLGIIGALIPAFLTA